MLDDLRNSAIPPFEEESSPPERKPPEVKPQRREPFLGMTAPQRFLLVLMLFLMTCVLGSFCLILTERVVLPLF